MDLLRVFRVIIGVTVTVVTVISTGLADRNEFAVLSDAGCACPSGMLTFNCTAVGLGSTLWIGTAFDCTNLGNEIFLRHTQFTAGGISGTCNDGDIVGRSLEVVDNCYTSQLNVTVSSNLNNKTVECIHSGNAGIITIGLTTLTVVEAPYPPPINFHLTSIGEGTLAFSWSSPYNSNCASVSYDIMSSCGSCSGTSTTTNFTCPNLQLSSEAQSCTFSARTMVCDSMGESSNQIVLTLKVPAVPNVIIIPVYSNKSQSLAEVNFRIYQPVPFTIADGITGAISTYLIHLTSELGVMNMYSKVSCGIAENSCEYVIEVPPSTCSSGDISVAVSAVNRLGEGPASNQTIIGCTNQFVKVEYINSASYTITCKFLNQLDSSEKSCTVHYGRCDEMFTEMASVNTSSINATLYLNPSSLSPGASYCYTVMASNGSYSVMIKGKIDISGDVSNARIIAPVVIIISLILAIVISIVVIVLCVRRRKKGDVELVPLEELEVRFTEDDLRHLHLKPVDTNEWLIERYVVNNDCSLKEYLKRSDLRFERGCAYFEFDGDIESISEDNEFIFMENETLRMFSPGVGVEKLQRLHLLGERVLKPSLKSYTIFVQSIGLGSRHLARGSLLLYKKSQPHPLWEVYPDKFVMAQLENDTTLGDLYQGQGQEMDIFLEIGCVYDEEEMDEGSSGVENGNGSGEEVTTHDVVLFDKDTRKFLTGPSAHCMVKDYRKGLELINKQRWTVFVLSDKSFNEQLLLKKGTEVLYHRFSEHQQLSKSVPLVHIKSEKLQLKKMTETIKLGKFRDQHNLTCNERNLFVEVGKVPVKKSLDMIVIHKDSWQFYTGPALAHAAEHNEDHAEKWRTFILCDFDKDMLLLKNSTVLYQVSQIFSPLQLSGIMPVYSEQFLRAEVKIGDKIEHFFHEGIVFLELGCFQDMERDTSKSDVILLDKHDRRLFTGPGAHHQLLGVPDTDSNHSNVMWSVLIPCKYSRGIQCLQDTTVLYQSNNVCAQIFRVLEVDEDNVRMSTFVTNKLKLNKFENGKAFYEFVQEEDLLYYKEVVLLPNRHNVKEKDLIACEIRSFYDIPGVPSIALKPVSLKFNTRIFLQSNSYGSRCLKHGELVLYKVTV